MDQNRVKELFALLPPGSAYPAAPRRSPFQSARQAPSERFALALRDTAFGWNFVEAHQKRRWLPDTINEWVLLQCFVARRLGVTDQLMVEVESFRTETRRLERNLLEALLLAEDITLAGIAEVLNTSEEVVEAYEVLFWNVRDRKHEQAYLNAMLYPAGWQAAVRDAKPTPEGDRLRLLRAGAQEGAEAVLVLAGYKPRPSMEAFADTRGQMLDRVQADAARLWAVGCRMEAPVIRAAHSAAVQQHDLTQDRDEQALHHINAVSPALEEIQKYNAIGSPPPPDYDSEQARAEIQSMLRTGAVKPKE